MKRTPLKRGTKQMKRSGFKQRGYFINRKSFNSTPKVRKPKTEKKKIEDKLWELCKQITRDRYGNTCYTCGKTGLLGGNWHTGHFIPRSVGGAYLRYDLRNLRPQCPYCNVTLSGNGAVFYRNLVEREGQKYVDELFQDKKKSVKSSDHYQSLLAEYGIYHPKVIPN